MEISFWAFEILGIPIWFWSFLIFCGSCIIWLFIDKQKRNKLFWEEHDLKNAQRMTHHGSTAPFGVTSIILSPHKWVIIEWDKYENELIVWEPKHTYKTPDKYKLTKGSLNWSISETPRQRTTVEEYFKRQVM